MSDNTIFQNDTQPVSPPPTQDPGSFAVLDEEEDSPSFLSRIVKIGGILLVVLLIFFVVVRFVLPIFSKPKTEKVSLSYWGLWEDNRIMQGMLDDFHRENPNITVTYTKQDVKQYRQRLDARVHNGTGPDIFRYHNSWIPQVSSFLVPLSTDVITKDEFQKSFYPVVQTDLIKNGALYGIPIGIDTLALFVNTEIFKDAGVAPPTSWDDFSKVARSLTVKDENGKFKTSGAALGSFDNVTHAPDILSLLFVQNGANLKNLQATPKSAGDALTFYTSFTSGESAVWDDTQDPSILAFAKGNLAMFFGYSYDVFTLKAANPKLSFQVLPVPRLPGKSMTIASYWVEGVSAKSKHQKEALKFMQFLAKKETQQKLFAAEAKTRLFGEPYARKDLAASLKNDEWAGTFVSQADNASSSFFVSNTYDDGLNEQMNTYLGNAVRSVAQNSSPQTAIQTLSQGVAQVFAKYGQ